MDVFEYFLIICFISLIFFYIKYRINKKKSDYIDNYNFPKKINKELKENYPQLSEEDVSIVFRGLKEYFKLYINGNRRIIVIPSHIINRAWHEFIQEKEEYESFCNNAFERILEHAPLKGMEDKNTASRELKIVWTLACEREDIDIEEPHKLPLIFSLDALFNVKDGFKYSLNCSEVDNNDKLSFCAKKIGSIGLSSAYGGRNI